MPPRAGHVTGSRCRCHFRLPVACARCYADVGLCVCACVRGAALAAAPMGAGGGGGGGGGSEATNPRGRRPPPGPPTAPWRGGGGGGGGGGGAGVLLSSASQLRARHAEAPDSSLAMVGMVVVAICVIGGAVFFLM
eukprot:COSAG01_NODE_1208_length_11239_cov_36.000987_19_plen_136_part_00